MAEGINIIGGFNLAKKRPLDLRQKVADQAARLAITWLYKGLVVRQDDTGQRFLYIGDETSNLTGDWQLFGSLLTGSGVPSGTIGVVGDIYLDIVTSTLYAKTGTTTWTNLFSLVGAQIYVGTTDPPSNGTGNNGDIFYVQTVDTGITVVKLYRKEAGVWIYKFNVNGSDGESVYIYVAYANSLSGTGYILVQSNDDTASLSAPDSSKTHWAILTSTTKIGALLPGTFFDGLWSRFAGDGDRWTTTSASSVTIGIGTKTFIVEEDLAYITGQRAVAAEPGLPDNSMEGTVISYNPLDGELIIDVDTVGSGTGTIADWQVSLQSSSSVSTIINFSNNDVDTGTEPVDSVSATVAKHVIWEYTIVKGANTRVGVLQAALNGTTIEPSDITLITIGTVDVILDVDLLAGNLRLLAIATSNDWVVKGKRRVISD